jgi:hypothetical protein
MGSGFHTFWCTGWAWNCQIIFRFASIHGRACFILCIKGSEVILDYFQIILSFPTCASVFHLINEASSVIIRYIANIFHVFSVILFDSSRRRKEVHQKVSRFFGPRYIGDDFFLEPNLVSFNRAVVPYEISKVNFRVEAKILVSMSEEIE